MRSSEAPGAWFNATTEGPSSRVLQVALPERSMLDQLKFESPLLDERFMPVEEVEELKKKRCVFVKTGGPYVRTTNLRQFPNVLMTPHIASNTREANKRMAGMVVENLRHWAHGEIDAVHTIW